MSECQATPEQLQKWREEFEFWASDEGANPKAIEKGNSGEYRLMQTHMFWLSFKAARAIDAQRIAELEAQVAAIQWQPIETAPKDGTVFVGAGLNDGASDRGMHFIEAAYVDGLFREVAHSQSGNVQYYGAALAYLTCWMPHPKASKEVERAAAEIGRNMK